MGSLSIPEGHQCQIGEGALAVPAGARYCILTTRYPRNPGLVKGKIDPLRCVFSRRFLLDPQPACACLGGLGGHVERLAFLNILPSFGVLSNIFFQIFRICHQKSPKRPNCQQGPFAESLAEATAADALWGWGGRVAELEEGGALQSAGITWKVCCGCVLHSSSRWAYLVCPFWVFACNFGPFLVQHVSSFEKDVGMMSGVG